MEFEYDILKSKSNKEKHNIDFDEAQNLWHDENMLVFSLHFEDEERKACIAKLHNKIWTAIFTCRKNRVRLISVRRARKDEVSIYESE